MAGFIGLTRESFDKLDQALMGDPSESTWSRRTSTADGRYGAYLSLSGKTLSLISKDGTALSSFTLP